MHPFDVTQNTRKKSREGAHIENHEPCKSLNWHVFELN